ncbi:MAG: type II secretion system F family protein [Candidatus Omnitrophota bacterium]
MRYKYRAKKGPQDIVEAIIEASSETEAVEKISALGLLPVHIEEVRDSAQASMPYPNKINIKINSREITIFSRQLASLMRSGVPILAALNIISEQSESPNLKSMLRNIYDSVKAGETFSGSLSQYPNVFSALYIALIRAGEDTGGLSDALLRITDYRIKIEEMYSRLRMALAYPVLMAVVGLATVIFMLTFVMPRLMQIFTNLGEQLPLPTRILISISDTLRHDWLWIIIILSAFILVAKRQIRTPAGKISFSIMQLRLPVLGSFILKAELARFARTLSILLKSGIPILRAINIAIPVLDNEVIKKQLQQSYKELEQGGSFGRSLKGSKVFPLLMSNLITVGEESGKLEESLAEVASSYERDTDEAMRMMASLLEPLMILVMGLIVGFIVVAMLLPVFEMNVMAR